MRIFTVAGFDWVIHYFGKRVSSVRKFYWWSISKIKLLKIQNFNLNQNVRWASEHFWCMNSYLTYDSIFQRTTLILFDCCVAKHDLFLIYYWFIYIYWFFSRCKTALNFGLSRIFAAIHYPRRLLLSVS